MTHEEEVREAIYLCVDAMPKQIRRCDMALLFAIFVRMYDMEEDLDAIGDEVSRIIENHANEKSENKVKLNAAVTDADKFLARIQDENLPPPPPPIA